MSPDDLPHDLQDGLIAVGEAARDLREPWWIFGGAAMALYGLTDIHVPDIDVLCAPRDARNLLGALGGVVIATIVLAAEGLSAVRAALRNRLQRAVNLLLGAALSTIGMTVPAVLAIGVFTGQAVVLGLPPAQQVVLALSLLAAIQTFGARRTNVLHGAVHLVIVAALPGERTPIWLANAALYPVSAMGARMIQIATGDPRPITKQIVDAVRMKIATGDLAPGAQLPSVRGLAQQLTINPNTVAKAYAELTTEGWLESRQGLGLFVAPPRQRLSDAERERRLDEAIQRFLHDVIALDYPPDEVQARLQQARRRRAGRWRPV